MKLTCPQYLDFLPSLWLELGVKPHPFDDVESGKLVIEVILYKLVFVYQWSDVESCLLIHLVYIRDQMTNFLTYSNWYYIKDLYR